MKLSAHFDLLNERPRCRIDGDGGERKIEGERGGRIYRIHILGAL